MANDWIDNLTANIRNNARESAEAFGRQQHRSAVITEKGRGFFTAVIISLENNIIEIRRQLQGDVTSSETVFTNISPTEVKITRSRFPWFDAVITLQDPDIVLDYAKGPGIAGDPVIAQSGDRHVEYLQFQVDDSDALSIQHPYDDNSQSFERPEDLARYITEQLFKL